MDQAKLTETRLQVDLGIEIEMTDTNASDTSQSVTRNYGEGRTDLTAGQERDTAADQSAQRPRSDGKDESTESPQWERVPGPDDDASKFLKFGHRRVRRK